MSLSTTDVLERVYELPGTLKAHVALGRQVSLLGLVEATGYRDIREEITVAALKHGFRERREIPAAWLRYSIEKEADWGWFFEKDARGNYAVGLKSRLSDDTRCEIPDPWEACALFVKREPVFAIESGLPKHAGAEGEPSEGEARCAEDLVARRSSGPRRRHGPAKQPGRSAGLCP